MARLIRGRPLRARWRGVGLAENCARSGRQASRTHGYRGGWGRRMGVRRIDVVCRSRGQSQRGRCASHARKRRRFYLSGIDRAGRPSVGGRDSCQRKARNHSYDRSSAAEDAMRRSRQPHGDEITELRRQVVRGRDAATWGRRARNFSRPLGDRICGFVRTCRRQRRSRRPARLRVRG
jgi:hypothetical protein